METMKTGNIKNEYREKKVKHLITIGLYAK